MSLIIKNLSKSFGKKKAVNNLSLFVEKGKVLGVLGHNGAGKTTTIRMLLNLLKPDTGEISWDGKNIKESKVKIGYLPEERGLFTKSKVVDQLHYFAKLDGLSRVEATKSINYWIKRLNVEEYKNKKSGDLSKGNQQKIQLITALLHDPDIVILDEPFSGLDPFNSDLLKSVIEELINKGKTIFLSSHRMESVEEFCEDICILNKGKAVLSGNLSEIKKDYGYKYAYLKIKSKDEQLQDITLPHEKKGEMYIFKVKRNKDILDIIPHIEKKYSISDLIIKEPSLHQIFLEKAGN